MKIVGQFLAGLAFVLVLGTAVAIPVSAQRTDPASLEAKAAALSDSLADFTPTRCGRGDQILPPRPFAHAGRGLTMAESERL